MHQAAQLPVVESFLCANNSGNYPLLVERTHQGIERDWDVPQRILATTFLKAL